MYKKQRPAFKLLNFLLIISLLNMTGCTGARQYRISNFFIDNSIHELKQNRIAVLPFENLTKIDNASLLITDEFNLQLGKLGKFDLVERMRIEELFKEQDFHKDRIDEATAVKIGKMLGAHAVVLGVITKYTPCENDKQITQSPEPSPPPIVISDHHHKAKEEKADDWSLLDTVIFVGAMISVIGITYIFFVQPSTEVGVSVRMINVETGQYLWQAKDTFKGNRPSLKTLAKTKEERKRLRKDVDFLTQLLCQQLAETLK
ncbi:hypothetical protein HY792_02400 [Candidatus Desantisbacteria bacterium]|nr:hypothetical protein [Candidatus Desantisbacteria bacterium]